MTSEEIESKSPKDISKAKIKIKSKGIKRKRSNKQKTQENTNETFTLIKDAAHSSRKSHVSIFK